MSIPRSRPTSAFRSDLRLDWSQLPAMIIQPHLRLEHTSYWHRPSRWRPNTTTTSVISDNKLSSLLYLLPCLFVPFIIFGCHYSHALNLNSFAGSTRLSAPQHPDTLSDKLQETALKLAIFLSFLSLSFLFLLYNLKKKTLLSVLSFWISIRTRKLRNLLFELTVWIYCLILHTKAP